jgi:hypothetical protein
LLLLVARSSALTAQRSRTACDVWLART